MGHCHAFPWRGRCLEGHNRLKTGSWAATAYDPCHGKEASGGYAYVKGGQSLHQKASLEMTSCPLHVPSARQGALEIVFLTNRAEPSRNRTFTPPEW